MNVRSLLVALVLLAGAARAEPLDTLGTLDQAAFVELSETLAAGLHYKGVAPAERLGTFGLDIGLELSSTRIDRALFDRASDGDYGADSLLLSRLHVHKGLPFGLDVGAFVGAVPASDLRLVGAELRVSLLEGDVALPAIALRGSYSRLQGTSALELDNGALELMLSKGFLMFTPYAGAGLVRSTATPRGADALAEESFNQEKVFIGLNVNFVALNVAAEADRTGEHTSVSAKLGLRF